MLLIPSQSEIECRHVQNILVVAQGMLGHVKVQNLQNSVGELGRVAGSQPRVDFNKPVRIRVTFLK